MLQLSFLIVFAPIASLLLIAIVPHLRRREKAGTPGVPLRASGPGVPLAAGVVSVAGALLALGASLVLLVRVWGLENPHFVFTINWLPHSGQTLAVLGLRVDGISASMAAVVALVAACVQVYSLGYMADEDRPGIARYFAWQSLFLFSMEALVLAPDMLQFFLAWELVGLCSYLLIGFYYKKPSAARAAVKAFWVTKFADMALLVGIVLLRRDFGTFSWEGLHPSPALTAVAVLFFLGAMGKSAQFPLHVWLPDAMEGPTPVSALLHAATMVAAGVYLVVRSFPIFAAAPEALTLMAWIGAITAFLAAAMAFVQEDIKKVLAYSTCSQLGYMMAALGSGSLMAGYFHLTTHAFFKALLFLGAGAVIHSVHSNNLSDMGGLWRTLKVPTLLFLAGTLALVGIPGFSGFFSKDLVLEHLQESGQWGPFALCLAGVGMTAFYMGRVLFRAFFGPAHAASRGHAAGHAPTHGGTHATPWVMTVPMVLLALLAIGAGWAGGAFAELWGAEYAFHLTIAGSTATVLALGGLGLAWLMYGSRTIAPFAFLAPLGAFIRSGPMDRIYLFGWNRGLLVVSSAAGWFDRYIVDGLINLAAWVTTQLGERMRTLQTGRAQDYVFAVMLGFVILAAWAIFGDTDAFGSLLSIGGGR
jgi:NADH-quinone oxidoreductase subunit L